MQLHQINPPVKKPKKLGRAFNHLEDLVFFYGTQGVIEALAHLEETAVHSGAQTIRRKWDGNPQIYWGRAQPGGPLILAGHNNWSRRVVTASPEELEDFIVNQSGNAQTAEDRAARKAFAKQFAGLYKMFDRATPEDFQGFVYADALFTQRPNLVNSVYSFSPNPHSQTCYHVERNSKLGQRVSQAQTMVVGHAYFFEFGAKDDLQQPIDNFEQFNLNADLIVLGPIYNKKAISTDQTEIEKIKQYALQNSNCIDNFLQEVKGLADLKNIIYTYVNQTAKKKQLDNLGKEHFFSWLSNSKVSKGKQEKIQLLDQDNDSALEVIFELIKSIQNIKDHAISQLQDYNEDIWESNGEGHVRYADKTKHFGNIKLVPRKEWTPA